MKAKAVLILVIIVKVAPATVVATATSATDGELLGVWHEQQVAQQFKTNKGGLAILGVFMLRLEIGLVIHRHMGQQTVR